MRYALYVDGDAVIWFDKKTDAIGALIRAYMRGCKYVVLKEVN